MITHSDCMLAAAKAIQYLESVSTLKFTDEDQEYLEWLISHEFLPNVEKISDNSKPQDATQPLQTGKD